MVMNCINSSMNFNKMQGNNSKTDYILKHMNCDIANEIEICIKSNLTCPDINTTDIVYELLWAVKNKICLIWNIDNNNNNNKDDGLIYLIIIASFFVPWGCCAIISKIMKKCNQRKKAKNISKDSTTSTISQDIPFNSGFFHSFQS